MIDISFKSSIYLHNKILKWEGMDDKELFEKNCKKYSDNKSHNCASCVVLSETRKTGVASAIVEIDQTHDDGKSQQAHLATPAFRSVISPYNHPCSIVCSVMITSIMHGVQGYV